MTFLGCFLAFTAPDLAASQLGKTLPYWFYESEVMQTLLTNMVYTQISLCLIWTLLWAYIQCIYMVQFNSTAGCWSSLAIPPDKAPQGLNLILVLLQQYIRMLAQAHRLDYCLRDCSHTGIALVPRNNIRQLHHQRTLQMRESFQSHQTLNPVRCPQNYGLMQQRDVLLT